MGSARTLAEMREAFKATGVTVAEWAEAGGFRRENVYAVLTGRLKGHRGESHRIAQALGLKAAVSEPVADLLFKRLKRASRDEATDASAKPSTREGIP